MKKFHEKLLRILKLNLSMLKQIEYKNVVKELEKI